MAFDIAPMILKIRGVTNQRVDDAEQGFFSDQEIINYMQDAWASLYYEMVSARKGYFVKNEEFIVGSDSKYSLPFDLFRIYKVQYKLGDNNYLPIEEIDLVDEEWYENRVALDQYWGTIPESSRPDRGFVLLNNDLHLFPPSSASGAYRLRYVPKVPDIESTLINPPEMIENPEYDEMSNPDVPQTISNPARQDFFFNVPDGFNLWIQWEAALTIGIPEEGDIKNIEKKRNEWMERIKKWMSDRTNNKPRSIKRTVDYHGNRYSNTFRGWPQVR